MEHPHRGQLAHANRRDLLDQRLKPATTIIHTSIDQPMLTISPQTIPVWVPADPSQPTAQKIVVTAAIRSPGFPSTAIELSEGDKDLARLYATIDEVPVEITSAFCPYDGDPTKIEITLGTAPTAGQEVRIYVAGGGADYVARNGAQCGGGVVQLFAN